MIKDNNYVTIQGWMSSKLGLKGNSLMIYAIIYGFCQDDDNCYQGSLKYIEDWTNSTRQGIIGTIKKLIDDKLIIKEESFPYNKYYINKSKLNELDCKLTLTDSKDTLQNNNINNKDNKFKDNLQQSSLIDEVIKYLNSICGTNYRSNSNSTKRIIKARISEGYKFDDFKDVIDFKWKEWGENPKKFSNGQMSDSYLRPSTLFVPSHFEEYLQAAWTDQLRSGNIPKALSTDKLEDRSDMSF